MKKFILGLLLGLILGGSIAAWSSITKTESTSVNAHSAVGYGVYNYTITPLKVSADGTLQLN